MTLVQLLYPRRVRVTSYLDKALYDDYLYLLIGFDQLSSKLTGKKSKNQPGNS